MRRFTVVAATGVLCAAVLRAQPSMPPTPTSLTAQSVPGNFPRVAMLWQAPVGPWYFVVYRSDADSLHMRPIASSPVLSFEDRSVQSNRTYFYSVTSVMFSDTGFVESQRSNIARTAVGPPGGSVRGSIRGIVSDDSTGGPIAGIRVRFYRQFGNISPTFDITDSLGRYEAVLDTGRYLVRAEPSNDHPPQQPYRAEWFDNVAEPWLATPVAVGNGTVSTAHFGLRRFTPVRFVTISGVVFTSQGTPLPNAAVVFLRSIQEMNYIAATTGTIPGLGEEAVDIAGIGYLRGRVWSGFTDSRGNYRASVPANGSYIGVSGKQGYALQYFDHVNDPTQATIISAAAETSGVNFALRSATSTPNVLRGVVRDSSGVGVPSRVILFPRPIDTQGSPSRVVHSDAGGAYEISNLEARSYIILSVPYSNYVSGFYKSGQFGVTQWQAADSVVVGGAVNGVVVGLLPVHSNGLTRVSGTARVLNGDPIVGGRITALSASGAVVGVGVTALNGTYSVEALAAGPVTVSVDRGAYNPRELSLTIPPNVYSYDNVDFTLTRTTPTSVGSASDGPLGFNLDQNYPNPFNPTTSFEFSVPSGRDLAGGGKVPSSDGSTSLTTRLVTLKVFDLLGREVAMLVNEVKQPGTYTVRWDATGAASGVYIYRLTAEEFTATKRLVLLK